jgi:hypothetical protein
LFSPVKDYAERYRRMATSWAAQRTHALTSTMIAAMSVARNSLRANVLAVFMASGLGEQNAYIWG